MRSRLNRCGRILFCAVLSCLQSLLGGLRFAKIRVAIVFASVPYGLYYAHRRYIIMLDDIKNYFADFDGATNICRTVALWITIALVVAFVITKVYIAVLGRRAVKAADGRTDIDKATRIVNGAWIVSALFVAMCFIIAFSSCYFVEGDAIVPILFYPLLVLAIAVVASATSLFFKPNTVVKIVCASVCGAALICVLACMIAYYASGKAGDASSNIGLYISAAFVTAGIIALAFFADRGKRLFDTKTVTFAAVCVALSFALSYVRLFKMPMGGSITFASMLPLMLFAFMFGSRRGVLVGLIYGVLQAIQDPWIIHPAQFALDYAVAFAAIGLTGCIRDFGLFKNNMRAQFALGACIACLFRFICHYFSGVYAFGMYAAVFADQYAMPLLANEYFYSLVYQSMYLVPELAIVLAVGMTVFASGNFRRQIAMYAQRYSAAPSDAAEKVEVFDSTERADGAENAEPAENMPADGLPSDAQPSQE